MRIGPKEIGETIIPLPPKEVQRRIVDTVESKIKKSDELLFAADEFGRKAALYLTDALQS
jgi:restriction endonuclease S subunit